MGLREILIVAEHRAKPIESNHNFVFLLAMLQIRPATNMQVVSIVAFALNSGLLFGDGSLLPSTCAISSLLMSGECHLSAKSMPQACRSHSALSAKLHIKALPGVTPNEVGPFGASSPSSTRGEHPLPAKMRWMQGSCWIGVWWGVCNNLGQPARISTTSWLQIQLTTSLCPPWRCGPLFSPIPAYRSPPQLSPTAWRLLQVKLQVKGSHARTPALRLTSSSQIAVKSDTDVRQEVYMWQLSRSMHAYVYVSVPMHLLQTMSRIIGPKDQDGFGVLHRGHCY